MAKLFANSGDLDQMSHFAVSDLGLYCLPITLLRVSRLKWVNYNACDIQHRKKNILYDILSNKSPNQPGEYTCIHRDGLDKTVWMYRLTWATALHIWHKGLFTHTAHHRIMCKQIVLTHCDLETPKRDAASDQGLHCLQIV